MHAEKENGIKNCLEISFSSVGNSYYLIEMYVKVGDNDNENGEYFALKLRCKYIVCY